MDNDNGLIEKGCRHYIVVGGYMSNVRKGQMYWTYLQEAHLGPSCMEQRRSQAHPRMIKNCQPSS